MNHNSLNTRSDGRRERRRTKRKSKITEQKKKRREGEEKMRGQMDVCCNTEWGGERGRLAGMVFVSKCMRH